MSGRRFGSRRGAAALVLAIGLFVGGAAPAADVGQTAPEFKALALDGGKSISLAAYRGKVVYLDFWASWCPPCLTSLPLLEKLRKEFPSDQFQILAVNVDQDTDKARKFLERTRVGYPSATDPKGRIPETYGIETMPTSFLIDRNGVIRYVHHGFRKGDVGPLRERIKELVAARKK
ncbi:MAG TPA: TlpA disulfide reductase family protein [Myxococcota bacterium]|jgi:peroxiredoxin